jgi:hypothetical protein
MAQQQLWNKLQKQQQQQQQKQQQQQSQLQQSSSQHSTSTDRNNAGAVERVIDSGVERGTDFHSHIRPPSSSMSSTSHSAVANSAGAVDDFARYIVVDPDSATDNFEWLTGASAALGAGGPIDIYSGMGMGMIGADNDPLISALLFQHQHQRNSPLSSSSAQAPPHDSTKAENIGDGDDGSTTWKAGQVPASVSSASAPSQPQQSQGRSSHTSPLVDIFAPYRSSPPSNTNNGLSSSPAVPSNSVRSPTPSRLSSSLTAALTMTHSNNTNGTSTELLHYFLFVNALRSLVSHGIGNEQYYEHRANLRLPHSSPLSGTSSSPTPNLNSNVHAATSQSPQPPGAGFSLNGFSSPGYDSFGSAGVGIMGMGFDLRSMGAGSGWFSPPIPGSSAPAPTSALSGALGNGTGMPMSMPYSYSQQQHQQQSSTQAQQHAQGPTMISSSAPSFQPLHQSPNVFFPQSHTHLFAPSSTTVPMSLSASSSPSSPSQLRQHQHQQFSPLQQLQTHLPASQTHTSPHPRSPHRLQSPNPNVSAPANPHHTFSFGSPSALSASLSSVSTSAYSHMSNFGGNFDFNGVNPNGGTGTIAPAQVYHTPPPRSAMQMSHHQHQASPLHQTYNMGSGGASWEGTGFLDNSAAQAQFSPTTGAMYLHGTGAGSPPTSNAQNALGLGLGLSPSASGVGGIGTALGLDSHGSPRGRGRRLRRATVRPATSAGNGAGTDANLWPSYTNMGGVFDMEMEMEDDLASNASTRHDDDAGVSDLEYPPDDEDEVEMYQRTNDRGGAFGDERDERADERDDDDEEDEEDDDDDEYRPQARRRRVSHHQDGATRTALFSPAHPGITLSSSAPPGNGNTVAMTSSASNLNNNSNRRSRPNPQGRHSTGGNGTIKARRQGTLRGMPTPSSLGGAGVAASTTGISTYTANGVTYASLPNSANSDGSNGGLTSMFDASGNGMGLGLAPGMSAAYLAASSASASIGGGASSAPAPASTTTLTKRSRGRQVPMVRLADVPAPAGLPTSIGAGIPSSATSAISTRSASGSISASRSSRRTRTLSRRLSEASANVEDDGVGGLDARLEDDGVTSDDDEYYDGAGGASSSNRSASESGRRRNVRASTRNARNAGRRTVKASPSVATIIPGGSAAAAAATDVARLQQEMTWSDGRTRAYVCRVNGCGKCFQRGEHLKRHIRSIHTNEKRQFDLLFLVIAVSPTSTRLVADSESSRSLISFSLQMSASWLHEGLQPS